MTHFKHHHHEHDRWQDHSARYHAEHAPVHEALGLEYCRRCRSHYDPSAPHAPYCFDNVPPQQGLFHCLACDDHHPPDQHTKVPRHRTHHRDIPRPTVQPRK